MCKDKSVLQNLAVTICSANVFILKIGLEMSMPQLSVQEAPGMDNSTITKWILEYKDLLREGDKEGMWESRNAG